MKRQAETRNSNDELPSFLDESSATTESGHGSDTTELDAATESSSAGESETSQPTFETEQVVEEEEPTVDTLATPPVRRPSSSRRTPVANQPRAGGGGLGIGLGCIALVAAVALGAMPTNEALNATLARFGLNPATLTVLGAVLVGSGTTRRRLGTLHGRIESASTQRGDGTEALQESLQFLVAAHQESSEKPPAAGEELQHLLIALNRQDEKINNLTKAIKMYGKPLMEISGQSTELAAGIAQVRTSIDTANESTRQTFSRLENQLRTTGSWKQDLAGLQESVQQLGKAMAAIESKPGAMPSFEPVTQQLQRIEVHVQAIGHRLEDNEVRKSLMRLEDTTLKANEDLKQLLRGESVEKASTHLQQRLESATARLNDGLNQMREGNLGGIETAIRDIQREVSGVATAVAQIQVAVKNGGTRTAAPAPAPMTASAPTAPAAPTTPAATAAPATAASTPGDAGYQTGTRTSNSKNVLGAIAKLKQMKN
jgi:uncharacterized phage infection (PIP) family protein YhgE